MAWKVLAVNPHPDDTLELQNSILESVGVQFQRVTVQNDADLIEVARDADVVVPMRYQLGAGAIAQLEKCRLIPSGGIGFDHIDADAATEKGILVTNVGNLFVEEVANHTWLLLLEAARHGFWLHEMATTNRWREAYDDFFPIQRRAMPRITGQVMGLIPFGRIPRAMARRAQGFGMSVIAYDPYVSAEAFRAAGVEQVSLEDVFRRADFVSCHLPLSKETFHLIGDAQFRLMKPTAYFLSTGRGKVVDEPALIAALQEGRIAGAGLDVLEQEPPDPNNPLLHMSNVAMTPHLGSLSDVSIVERRRLVANQTIAALQGVVPANVVNPKALPAWKARWAGVIAG
jgi:D-3-phosphoglycerate dehydrogenase